MPVRNVRPSLVAQVRNIPNQPGVYFFKDRRGRFLYIGKANALRDRVRQYFSGHDTRPMVPYLLREAAYIDWVTTRTPLEALVLEAQLIRRHQPRYNALLKDTRNLPYIRVTLQEPYPRAEVAFRIENDGARYFGPFLSVGHARRVLQFVHRIFRIRACDLPLDGTRTYPVCLLYHIRRCSGPCMHHIAQDAYRADAEAAARFLEGDREGVLAELERRMQEHARRMEFEAAAFYRDAIRALRDWTPTSRVVDPAGRSIDLVAHATGGGRTVLVVFLIRHGLFVDRREFVWDRPPGLEPSADTAVPVDEEWWTQVLTQFYLTVAQPPDEVWLPVALAERSELEAWLERHFGRPVRLRVPAELSEADRDRLEWVGHHARQLLQSAPEGEAADEYATLRALQHMLNLPTFPYRIEGFDISNIQGQWNVGGVVVFEGGRPKKSEYRRFRIRTVEGPDDYACMREAVYRRYAGSLRDRLSLPDLILIDGGKGQLHAALEALAQAGCSHIPAIALAKREEVIYVPTSPEPLRWPRHTPALRLLQHVRDEAHRWVIAYYRRLHRRAELQLALTEVPGIGPRLARRLLEHFGSLDALRQARVEEVARVIGRRRAEALCAWLQKD